jgi:hypothetical protein
MKWKKCNSKHALSSRYDYFVQGPNSQRWPFGYSTPRDLVRHLRETYGEGKIDTDAKDHWGLPVKVKNPQWYLDQPRRRIWVKSEVLMMIQLRGIG